MNNRPNVLIFTTQSPPDDILDSLSVPIGLYNLQYVLKSHGILCDVIDQQLNIESEYMEKVEKGFYNVIGISVTHWRMLEDLTFLHRLKDIYRKKNHACLFIAGGLQATINYAQWLTYGFDLACLGFSEMSLLDICSRMTHSSAPIHKLFNDCKGVAFLDPDGRVVYNPANALTNEAFEQLMYHNVINMELPYKEYWDFLKKRATGLLTANSRSYIIENGRLLTSSKCLGRCGFCSCPDFLRSAQGSVVKPMSLSAEQVNKLIVHYVTKYGARSFSFNDEDFLLGNKFGIERAIAICNLIVDSKRKNKIPDNVRFSCQTRPNCFLVKEVDGKTGVNHRLMQALYCAGFHNVTLGVETFSDRLLHSPSVNKGVSSKKCHAVLKGLMENKLFPTINLILGIPESTIEELLETIWQVMEYAEKPCQISHSINMRSFPGAPIYNSNDYPTHDAVFVNPVTNKAIKIKTFFKLHNPDMEMLFNRLDDKVNKEMKKYKAYYGLGKAVLLPRIIISLTTFLAIAKMTDNSKLVDNVTSKMQSFSKDI